MGDPSMRGVTYGLIIVLGVLLLLWWQGELDDLAVQDVLTGGQATVEVEREPSAAASAHGDAGLPETTMASMDQEITHAMPEPPRDDVTPEHMGPDAGEKTLPGDSDAPPTHEAELAMAVAQSLQTDDGENTNRQTPSIDSNEEPVTQVPVEMTQAGSPEAALPVDGGELQGALEQVVVAPSDDVSVQDPLTIRVGSEGKDRLMLTVDEDCWVSVVDAQGRRLLYRLVGAGASVTVRGDTPFQVTLGNAQAVDVRINGQTFDHSRFHQGNIARFSISASVDPGAGQTDTDP